MVMANANNLHTGDEAQFLPLSQLLKLNFTFYRIFLSEDLVDLLDISWGIFLIKKTPPPIGSTNPILFWKGLPQGRKKRRDFTASHVTWSSADWARVCAMTCEINTISQSNTIKDDLHEDESSEGQFDLPILVDKK
jgi:hypothetical protein